MKKYLLVTGVAFCLGVMSGCDTSPSTVCSGDYGSTVQCTTGTLEACANDSDVWYEVDGVYICSYQYSSSCVQTAATACNAKTSPESSKLLSDLVEAKAEHIIVVQENTTLTKSK